MWASTAESFDRSRNCSWIASTNSRRRFSRALETSSRLRLFDTRRETLVWRFSNFKIGALISSMG